MIDEAELYLSPSSPLVFVGRGELTWGRAASKMGSTRVVWSGSLLLPMGGGDRRLSV